MIWKSPNVPPPYGYRELLTWSCVNLEGGFQKWKNDPGNYWNDKVIGTNRGITPAAFHEYTSEEPTEEKIRALTVEQAVDIMLPRYYDEPDLDILPWCRPMAIVLDHALHGGPRPAIKLLQRTINRWVNADATLKVDGWPGPKTSKAIRLWIGSPLLLGSSFEQSASFHLDELVQSRIEAYRTLARIHPSFNDFVNGWVLRAQQFKAFGPWVKTLPDNFPFRD